MADRPEVLGKERAVLPLDQVGRADAGQVGGKAANLGELKRAGLPVPDGFVLISEPGRELAAALSALGPGPAAVRSSGVAEDLEEASFAGQYESVLNVSGLERVIEAIGRCREAAASERVASYRAERAAEAKTTTLMPVLIQRMLQPDASGVAFTANPVTGDRREVVISAVRGFGERLVSGEARADEWIVRNGQACQVRSAEGAITEAQAIGVASLARRAEAHFGRQQDVEWAFEGDQLYLLQSRPMTALPPEVDWIPPGPGYWMSCVADRGVNPGPP